MRGVLLNPSCVISQATNDFEGFFKSHMTEEEKAIVQVQTSLSV